jgi:hypothetical protein
MPEAASRTGTDPKARAAQIKRLEKTTAYCLSVRNESEKPMVNRTQDRRKPRDISERPPPRSSMPRSATVPLSPGTTRTAAEKTSSTAARIVRSAAYFASQTSIS